MKKLKQLIREEFRLKESSKGDFIVRLDELCRQYSQSLSPSEMREILQKATKNVWDYFE